MIVILIVSGTFMLFGLAFGALYLYFKNNGRILSASVYGIERYQSRNNKKTSTFYRPIIKYNFKGQSYIFSSSYGSSEINFRINDKVKVISLNKGADYVRLKTKIQWLFPLSFFTIGMVGSAVYFYNYPSMMYLSIFITALALIPFYLHHYLKSKKLLDKFIEYALVVKLEDEESMKGREIFTDKKELEKTLKKYKYIAFIFTLIFSISTSTGLYFSWKKTKESSKEYFFELLNNLELINNIEIYIKDRSFFLSLILMLFTALLIYSLIFQTFKRK